uniref:Uncharacterized protein n=1 Tax=Seriola dumerili TaxID=41447 RepID=A0A3B4TCY6_SERDU
RTKGSRQGLCVTLGYYKQTRQVRETGGDSSHQNGQPNDGHCHGDPGKQSIPHTPEASAAGSWRLALSFCTLPGETCTEKGGVEGSEDGNINTITHTPLSWKHFLCTPFSPPHPSSWCGPSPLPAGPSGPHPHFPQHRAAQPWPGAFLFPHSVHEPSLPTVQDKTIYIWLYPKRALKNKNKQ